MNPTKYAKNALDISRYLFDRDRDIEFFGMFGPGNLGDEAMLVAANRNFARGRVLPWRPYNRYPWLNKLIEGRRREKLIVGGGTLIHGGDTGWLESIELRSKQGANVVFLGTGIAFDAEQIAAKSDAYLRWRDVLMRSEEIHLRGPHSVQICRGMGVAADIFGDFAFLLCDSDGRSVSHASRRDVIGINVGNCLGDQGLFEDTIAAFVKNLAFNYQIIFHIVVDTDVEATRRIIDRSGISSERYRMEHHYYDPIAFMHAIREYRGFIGLKLHAAGLAMVAGVPALMIAYKQKCLDFMAPLGPCSHMLLDLPLDSEDLLGRFERLVANPDEFVVRDRIAAIAVRQRETLKRIFPNHERSRKLFGILDWMSGSPTGGAA